MIKEVFAAYDRCENELREYIRLNPTDDYEQFLRDVVRFLENYSPIDCDMPSHENMALIRSGGTPGKILCICSGRYRHLGNFFYCTLDYESCHVCYALRDVLSESRGPVTESQLNDYMLIAWHIVESMKVIRGEGDPILCDRI